MFKFFCYFETSCSNSCFISSESFYIFFVFFFISAVRFLNFRFSINCRFVIFSFLNSVFQALLESLFYVLLFFRSRSLNFTFYVYIIYFYNFCYYREIALQKSLDLVYETNKFFKIFIKLLKSYIQTDIDYDNDDKKVWSSCFHLIVEMLSTAKQNNFVCNYFMTYN